MNVLAGIHNTVYFSWFYCNYLDNNIGAFVLFHCKALKIRDDVGHLVIPVDTVLNYLNIL